MTKRLGRTKGGFRGSQASPPWLTNFSGDMEGASDLAAAPPAEYEKYARHIKDEHAEQTGTIS